MRNHCRTKLCSVSLTGLFLIVASGLLAGCGGGDDGVSPPPPQGSIITGTVPGTVIHAYGDDGSYFSTETDPNATPPRPFSITVKPGIGYRLVLEENGVFLPMVFGSGSANNNADTNRFYMSIVNGVLDLGFIDTSSGTKAVPTINPLSVVDTDDDGTADLDDPDFQLPASDPLDEDGDFIPNILDADFGGPTADDVDGDGIPNAQDADIDNDGLQNEDDPDADGGLIDDDKDGFREVDGDCDDGNPNIHPGAADIPLNDIDENCDGQDSDPVDEILQRSLDQLYALNFSGALLSFNEVVAIDPDHQLGNLGSAVSRIAAVLTDQSPGTDPDKLESMKEVLDGFGFSQSGRDLQNFTSRPPALTKQIEIYPGYYSTIQCYELPPDSPTPNEVRDYINEKIVPQLQAALVNLEAVTPGFNHILSQPVDVNGVVLDEVDYGEVLAFKSAIHAALTAVEFLNAYDIAFDFDELWNSQNCNKIDPQTFPGTTVQEFLDQYPNLGKLIAPTPLDQLRQFATSTVNDVIAALDSISKETDPQDNDFLTIDLLTYGADRQLLVDILSAFDGPVTFALADGGSLTVDGVPALSGLNLRDFVPDFLDSYLLYDSIPDPTVGGVFPDTMFQDAIELLDTKKPHLDISDFNGFLTNPVSAEIRLNDVESLSDGTTLVGSGVDINSLSIYFYCSSAQGCSVSGQDAVGSAVTFPARANITSLFEASSGTDGEYTLSPHGGSLTFNEGTTPYPTSFYLDGSVEDRSGNFSGVNYAQFTFATLADFQGTYTGNYYGDDSGTLIGTVDAAGNVTGSITPSGGSPIPLSGTVVLDSNSNRAILTGTTTSGTTFSGTINVGGFISGSWENSALGEQGYFNVNRVDFRGTYNGDYSGDNFGTVTFTVDAAGNVAGSITPSGGSPVTLSGIVTLNSSLNDGTFTATATDGTAFSGTIFLYGGVSGTWENSSSGEQGFFSASR